jgi:two-component system response regulator AlgR
VTEVLVADDEALARVRLRQLLEMVLPGVEIIEACDGREALLLLQGRPVDLVFLDIRMPGIDGIEVVRHLAALGVEAPRVIFTTAYDRFAIQAFEVGAVGYLVKPIRPEQLSMTMERIQRGWPRVSLTPDGARRRWIVSRSSGELRMVAVGMVLYFEAQDKYVRAVHAQGQLLLNEPLAALETEFADRFVRVHRRFLVAHDRIHRLVHEPSGDRFIELVGYPARIPVSRRLAPALRRKILAPD